jgi:aspartate aminotransferase
MGVHPDCEDVKDVAAGLIYTLRTLGFVNASALIQNVVSSINVMAPVDSYLKKMNFMFNSLTNLGYSPVRPQGAFFLFVPTPVEDDLAFVNELKNHLVLTVPGTVFNAPGYFRVSYCLDDNILEGSLDGFRHTIAKFRK